MNFASAAVRKLRVAGNIKISFMKLHVIVTAFNRPTDLKRLCYDWILQTCPSWEIRIIHDGPCPAGLYSFIYSLRDKRISFIETVKVNGYWGHPNRKTMLRQTRGDLNDYILITNDDNQYVKSFWEIFARYCSPKIGMVYCNTVHNYFDYEILQSEPRVGKIDMGSFIVKLDIAIKVGFNQIIEVADGLYAEECAAECIKRDLRIVKINKSLFIHN